MMHTDRSEPTAGQIEDVAWQFLRSEFTETCFAHWPIDRRLDAFLLHHGYRRLYDDGSAYSALLDRVMANIAPAVRVGVLPSKQMNDPIGAVHSDGTAKSAS